MSDTVFSSFPKNLLGSSIAPGNSENNQDPLTPNVSEYSQESLDNSVGFDNSPFFISKEVKPLVARNVAQDVSYKPRPVELSTDTTSLSDFELPTITQPVIGPRTAEEVHKAAENIMYEELPELRRIAREIVSSPLLSQKAEITLNFNKYKNQNPSAENVNNLQNGQAKIERNQTIHEDPSTFGFGSSTENEPKNSFSQSEDVEPVFDQTLSLQNNTERFEILQPIFENNAEKNQGITSNLVEDVMNEPDIFQQNQHSENSTETQYDMQAYSSPAQLTSGSNSSTTMSVASTVPPASVDSQIPSNIMLMHSQIHTKALQAVPPINLANQTNNSFANNNTDLAYPTPHFAESETCLVAPASNIMTGETTNIRRGGAFVTTTTTTTTVVRKPLPPIGGPIISNFQNAPLLSLMNVGSIKLRQPSPLTQCFLSDEVTLNSSLSNVRFGVNSDYQNFLHNHELQEEAPIIHKTSDGSLSSNSVPPSTGSFGGNLSLSPSYQNSNTYESSSSNNTQPNMQQENPDQAETSSLLSLVSGFSNLIVDVSMLPESMTESEMLSPTSNLISSELSIQSANFSVEETQAGQSSIPGRVPSDCLVKSNKCDSVFQMAKAVPKTNSIGVYMHTTSIKRARNNAEKSTQGSLKSMNANSIFSLSSLYKPLPAVPQNKNESSMQAGAVEERECDGNQQKQQSQKDDKPNTRNESENKSINTDTKAGNNSSTPSKSDYNSQASNSTHKARQFINVIGLVNEEANVEKLVVSKSIKESFNLKPVPENNELGNDQDFFPNPKAPRQSIGQQTPRSKYIYHVPSVYSKRIPHPSLQPTKLNKSGISWIRARRVTLTPLKLDIKENENDEYGVKPSSSATASDETVRDETAEGLNFLNQIQHANPKPTNKNRMSITQRLFENIAKLHISKDPKGIGRLSPPLLSKDQREDKIRMDERLMSHIYGDEVNPGPNTSFLNTEKRQNSTEESQSQNPVRGLERTTLNCLNNRHTQTPKTYNKMTAKKQKNNRKKHNVNSHGFTHHLHFSEYPPMRPFVKSCAKSPVQLSTATKKFTPLFPEPQENTESVPLNNEEKRMSLSSSLVLKTKFKTVWGKTLSKKKNVQ